MPNFIARWIWRASCRTSSAPARPCFFRWRAAALAGGLRVRQCFALGLTLCGRRAGFNGERTFAELLHPDDADRVLAEAQFLVAAGETAFRRNIGSSRRTAPSADGRSYDGHAGYLRAPVNFEGVLTDISERKLADRAAQQRRHQSGRCSIR